MPVATDGTQVLLAGSPPLPVDYAFATVWASVIAIKGSELLKADAFDQVLHITVTCRYLAGLEEDMTVSWDGRVFQIEYIEDPDGRKFEHRVYCTESGTNG
jgi:SPP1 family predicted phage head-tail adaptor